MYKDTPNQQCQSVTVLFKNGSSAMEMENGTQKK